MCRKAVLTPEKEVPAEKRADEALVSEETFELDEDSVVLSDWMPITEQKPLKRGLYVVTYLNKRGVASTKFAFWDKRREQWFLFCRRATGKLFAPPCETVIAWHKMPADNHFAKGPGDWGWVANRDPIVRRGTFLCLVKSGALTVGATA